jgi:hypothetical protein
MTPRTRALVGLGIALVSSAVCIASILPDPPTVIDWKFDVTSNASLEADCARTTNPYAPLDGAMGRSYRADQWGHGATSRLAYHTFISFDFGVDHDPPRLLYELTADNFFCSFPKNYRGSLRLNVNGPLTKQEVTRMMREVGRSARVPSEETDAVVRQFEAGGTGLDVSGSGDSRYSDVVTDHPLRLERAGLTIWFSVEDAPGKSEVPARVTPEEPRYSISVGFAPLS